MLLTCSARKDEKYSQDTKPCPTNHTFLDFPSHQAATSMEKALVTLRPLESDMLSAPMACILAARECRGAGALDCARSFATAAALAAFIFSVEHKCHPTPRCTKTGHCETV